MSTSNQLKIIQSCEPEQLREIAFLHQFWGLGIEIVRDLFLHINDRRLRFSSEFMTKPDTPQHLKDYLVSFCSSISVLTELSLKLPMRQGVDAHCEKLLRKIIEQYERIVTISRIRVDFCRIADFETSRSLIKKFDTKPSEWIFNQALVMMTKYFTDIEILKKVLGPNEKKGKGLLVKEPLQYIIENLTSIKDELEERHRTEAMTESFLNGAYLLLERFDLLINMLSW